MIKTDFMKLYEELSEIQEAGASRPFPQGYVEAAESIDLSDCRMITSDVVDIRGELEESACLDYKGVLTRVAASVLPFRDGPEGKEVFLKLWRSAVYLLGGGIDIVKDGTDPARTVARESFEECNMKLSNIKDSGCSYWEYSEKPWVERHVATPTDRWNGYYTWLFTADYTGEGDNEFPEEGDNFRWHKVSDILARPDTKKLKFIKQAIIQGGYAEAPALKEDVLTEGKQLGYVSYAVRKSPVATGHPISSLLKILKSGYIKASTEEDGSKYVSLSRDLMSHLGAGTDWKCGIVLDGDKLANKYKVKPVNHNSMIYFGNNQSTKQLVLRYVAKYQALDSEGQVTDRAFWVVSMQGSSFINEISEGTYEILKTLMNAHNGQLAVSDTGKASDKYKGKTNQEVKKFFDIRHTGSIAQSKNNPDWKAFISNPDNDIPQWLRDTDSKPALIATGSLMQPYRVPKKYADASWRCTECIGYNSPTSGLILKATKLGQYKDLIISTHGVDITSHKFFSAIGGTYADEAEERIEAQLLKLVDQHGETSDETAEDFGMDITGCIKAILIDDKHRAAFRDFTEDELKSRKVLRLYKDGLQISQVDNTPGIRELALDIRHFAKQNNIPIVLFIPGVTTNSDVLDEIRGLPPKRLRFNIMKMQQAQKQELPEGDL